MKRFPLAVAVAAVVAGGVAHSYQMGIYDNGLLVPQVVHNGVGDTTAVGLITHGCPVTPQNPARVFWAFFDENTKHLTDGFFPMTDKDVHAFVWANEAGQGLAGLTGYLTFFVDTDGDGALTSSDVPCLAGEAFHVVAGDADVAYKPVWPIDYVDTNGATGIPDLTSMDDVTITTLSAGALQGDTLIMRYSVANGDSTDVVTWSADDVGGTGVEYTVNMFDDQENRKSVNVPFPKEEQNVIDPSTIVGRPAGFVNGFIEWTTPVPGADTDGDGLPNYPKGGNDNGNDGNGVVSYSVIRSAAFSARQTVVNPHAGTPVPVQPPAPGP